MTTSLPQFFTLALILFHLYGKALYAFTGCQAFRSTHGTARCLFWHWRVYPRLTAAGNLILARGQKWNSHGCMEVVNLLFRLTIVVIWY